MENKTTTIRLLKDEKKLLDNFRIKGETYDDILLKIMGKRNIGN